MFTDPLPLPITAGIPLKKLPLYYPGLPTAYLTEAATMRSGRARRTRDEPLPILGLQCYFLLVPSPIFLSYLLLFAIQYKYSLFNFELPFLPLESLIEPSTSNYLHP
jgi:hypothetical protein